MDEKKEYMDCIKESQIGKILTLDELKECFDWKNSLKNIKDIYQRVLGE